MKFSFAVVALIAPLFASAVQVPTPVKRDATFNPVGISLTKIEPRSAEPVTNAERLARGLSLNPPRRRHHARHATPSGSPPTPYAGKVAVYKSDGSALGYIYKVGNAFGEYGITSDENQAVHVTFSAPADGSPFDLSATNGIVGDLPRIGAISGFASTDDDLHAGSFNYAYLGAVSQTGAGEGPAMKDNSFTRATKLDEAVQSAIWKIDASSKNLSAQYINTDGSSPKTEIVYYAADNVITLTGDHGAFESNFGPSDKVTLRVV